jgi:anti-sigma B factor antagonist
MLKVHAKNLGTATVLSLEGQIVAGETEVLRNIVDTLSAPSTVILDLTGVTVVDAHGLGVMLQLRERIQEKGMRFKLMNVSQPLNRVLEITHLNTVFQITPRIEFFPLVSRNLGTRAAA